MNEQELLATLANNPALLQALAATMKAAGTTPQVIPPHGPGGLLGVLGGPSRYINAMVQPLAGLQAKLPVRPSNLLNPIFGVFTGQTASTGSEPTVACAGGKIAGDLKVCHQTWQFGRMTRDSKVVQVDNAGEVINRGEFLDQQIVGNPFAALPLPAPVSAQDALRNKGAKAILEMYNALNRDYRHLIFDGNPANTAGSAGYIEYNGLDRIINTGYRDSYTGLVCPAADSTLKSFGNALVTTDASKTIDTITELFWFLTNLSKQVGLDPVTWAIVMRGSLFHALTAMWPCSYLTYRCNALGTGNQMQYDGNEAIRLRDDMRNNNYLLIDGMRIEVIIDDAVAETTPVAGTFQSDLYFVPLTIAGGQQVTYLEYFNFNGPYGAQEVINAMGAQAYYRITPDGRYLLHTMPPTYWCNQLSMVTKQRLICEAPFLAARLTGMRYQVMYHERSPFNGDPYFVNGGTTYMPVPTFTTPIA